MVYEKFSMAAKNIFGAEDESFVDQTGLVFSGKNLIKRKERIDGY
jgi:hypothetical protein